MNTVTNPAFIVSRLVPVWHAMRAQLVKPRTLTSMNPNASFKVKRAGRVLTMNEYQRMENINYTKGGGNNVTIQFGLLGGFGGIRVLGESPG